MTLLLAALLILNGVGPMTMNDLSITETERRLLSMGGIKSTVQICAARTFYRHLGLFKTGQQFDPIQLVYTLSSSRFPKETPLPRMAECGDIVFYSNELFGDALEILAGASAGSGLGPGRVSDASEARKTFERKNSGANNDRLQGNGLLTSTDASKFLGVSLRTLWAWKESGRIPSYKIGRTVRFKLADIEQALRNVRLGGLH